MNIFKHIATALTACAVTVAPSLARVDAYTDNLLRTVDNSSVTVLIDPHYCDRSIYGSWNPQELELVVCTHGSVDAEDLHTAKSGSQGTHRPDKRASSSHQPFLIYITARYIA